MNASACMMDCVCSIAGVERAGGSSIAKIVTSRIMSRGFKKSGSIALRARNTGKSNNRTKSNKYRTCWLNYGGRRTSIRMDGGKSMADRKYGRGR